MNAKNEGLLTFVQSTTCRCAVWAAVYECNPPDASLRPTGVLCCNICDPSLLDRTWPGPLPLANKTKAPQKGKLDLEVTKKLEIWRMDVIERDYALSTLASAAIMDDTIIALVSHFGRLPFAELELLLKPQWIWWDIYGKELDSYLKILPLREAKEKGKKARRKPGASRVEGGPEQLNSGFQLKQLKVMVPGPLGNTPYRNQISFHHYSFGDGEMNADEHQAGPSSSASTVIPVAPQFYMGTFSDYMPDTPLAPRPPPHAHHGRKRRRTGNSP